MKKIKTLFVTVHEPKYEMTSTLRPDTDWVFSDDCEISQKIDGTACAVINGHLFKRYDLKAGKTLPAGMTYECQEPDPVTGHHPHWVEVTNNDKYHLEAFNKQDKWPSGTYELVGPKVNGNPEKLNEHKLIKHGSIIIDLKLDKDNAYNQIKEYLETVDMEGLVFLNKVTGERFKIRKSDYKLKR